MVNLTQFTRQFGWIDVRGARTCKRSDGQPILKCTMDGREVLRMKDQCIIREIMEWQQEYQEWGFSHVLNARLEKVDGVEEMV